MRVVLVTVPGGLLDELLAVDEDEGLGGIRRSGVDDPFDQLGEDDGLATPSGQRDAHTPVTEVNVLQNGLDAFLLVVSQLEGSRRGGSGQSGQSTEGA